jgi:alpha-galactosidase
MSTKITIIGAGSFAFGLRLLRDIASYASLPSSSLAGSEVCLMDINADRLSYTEQLWHKMKELTPNIPLKVTATTDRRKALTDASYVVVAIHPGGNKAIILDGEIPKKWGERVGRPLMVHTNDTMSAGGIMRGARTIPVLNSILDDMAQVSVPGALLLNYSNPMAINTWGMNDHIRDNHYNLHTVGLCHSVWGTAILFRVWCGVLPNEFTYTCVGINHMAWYTKMMMKDPESEEGKWIDAYPILKKNLKESPPTGNYHPDTFRRELLDQFGYFCTEDSGMSSEMVPWPVRTRTDLFEKYRFAIEGPNLSKYNGAIHWTPEEDQKHFKRILESPRNYAMPKTPSLEYVQWIIGACEDAPDKNGVPIPFYFNGNVRNDGIIKNLPEGCCVEVPCFATRRGWGQTGPIIPAYQGELPPQCAALCMTNIKVHELVVKACQTGDAEYLKYALMFDPHISGVLDPAEIRQMGEELIAAEKQWLPQF